MAKDEMRRAELGDKGRHDLRVNSNSNCHSSDCIEREVSMWWHCLGRGLSHAVMGPA